jgi:hypothetical protein
MVLRQIVGSSNVGEGIGRSSRVTLQKENLLKLSKDSWPVPLTLFSQRAEVL